MKFLREGSMSDVYYTFQDIANNPDYSDIDAIAQIKKVMSQPTDDAEQFVARKLKLMHDTIAKHPSYKNDPMGVYEEMLDMIRTEYHDETYESKEMNPTTQTFSEDNDTNSLEQWKADVRKQYPQQASQIKFKGKGFGDTIVAEIPGKDQAFGEFNMETGDAWVAPMDEGVEEGSMPYPHGKPEAGDKITWYHSNNYPKIEGTVVGRKDGHLIVQSVDPSPRNTEKTVAKYRVPKNNILSVEQQGVAEGSVLDTDTTGYTKYDMDFVNNEINQIKKIQAKLLKIPGFTRKVNDKTSQLQLAEKIFNLMKRGHTFDGALVLAQKNPSQQGVAEALDKEGDYHVSVQKGKFLPSDRGGGSDENLNYLHDLMNISGTGGGPMLVTISDPRIATEVAAMYGGTVLKTRYGTYRIVQSKGQNQKTPTPEPELVGMREDGVAEGNYPNYPKEPDLDQDKRDFKRQELQHELGHERNNYAVVIDGRTWKVFADQRKAQNIARSLKSRGKNASVQETGASPTSESVGSGTGSTGRVSEDSAQGTENKQAWDKGHEAGYTGNEKCPCKPGSAEEKAWNAGHKVGRDERSHERHGVKEGSDFKNKAIKQQLNIVNTIQSLDLPAPMKEYLVAINDPNGKPFKMAYYSFPKGESARRDAAQIIGKKYGVDPAELVNAEHKFDHLYEPGGMKEGNMKSSENNPTGPSFAGGKWKGTDSAAQAKNKYVGEISEGTMPSVKLMRNIAEGLVRVDDLVLNRPVYGKPTDQDRRAVYRMVREFADAGIDYNDAVVELVEYFKHELSELAVAPTIPAVGGKPAIVAPTGTSVGSTTPPTANTAATTPGTVSSTAPGAAPVVAPPVTQQGVDALAQMVKNAGLSPSQISTLMSKAK